MIRPFLRWGYEKEMKVSRSNISRPCLQGMLPWSVQGTLFIQSLCWSLSLCSTLTCYQPSLCWWPTAGAVEVHSNLQCQCTSVFGRNRKVKVPSTRVRRPNVRRENYPKNQSGLGSEAVKTHDELRTLCDQASIFRRSSDPPQTRSSGSPGVVIKKSEAVREDEAGSHAHTGIQEALDGRKLPPLSGTIAKLP